MAAASNNISSILNIVLGVLVAISIAIAGWSLNKTIEMGEEQRLMQYQIQMLSNNKDADEKQDRQIRKHWKLHSWAKDQINKLGRHHDIPIQPWPDLD